MLTGCYLLYMCQEVKQNPGPLRNIKGGQSKPNLNFKDFNVEKLEPKEQILNHEKLDTQVQSPPPGDRDEDRGTPASEENGIAINEKVGIDGVMSKVDNKAISKLKSNDHSPAVEKKEHVDGVPTGAHHTETKPQGDAAANLPAGGRTEEEEHLKRDTEGASEEGRHPLDNGVVDNDQPGHNVDMRNNEIDHLPDNERKEEVVVMKKKKEPNEVVPVGITSNEPTSQNKKMEEVKPSAEEVIHASEATSEPSLPPGVKAIPKKKENSQSNGQGGVKAVPKMTGAVNREGERGDKAQMSAAEMARAIESGEMVSYQCFIQGWEGKLQN